VAIAIEEVVSLARVGQQGDSGVDLGRARLHGEAEAAAEDFRLRFEESLVREQQWMARALEAEKRVEDVRLSEQQVALWRALNLEEELERTRAERTSAEERAHAAARAAAALEAERQRLSAYHRAVEGSKGWRLIQFFRGLVGRRW